MSETGEERPSVAWLDGWAAHQYGIVSCPYHDLSQARSRFDWHRGWTAREARQQAGTLRVQPVYDMAPIHTAKGG